MYVSSILNFILLISCTGVWLHFFQFIWFKLWITICQSFSKFLLNGSFIPRSSLNSFTNIKRWWWQDHSWFKRQNALLFMMSINFDQLLLLLHCTGPMPHESTVVTLKSIGYLYGDSWNVFIYWSIIYMGKTIQLTAILDVS